MGLAVAIKDSRRKPLRIAVVSNTAWYLFNFRLNLMHALQAAGHTVVAIAPEDDYAPRIVAAGIDLEHVPISGGGTNPVSELRAVHRLWQIFRQQHIDLVLSYTPKGNLYSALACIVSHRAFVPNVSGLGRAFIRKSMVTTVATALYRFCFRRAELVFFQNNDDLSEFVRNRLVHPGKAERLPGSGVDLERFQPSSAEASSSDVTGTPVFLLVARMLWDKGVGEFVDAARLVRRQHPSARFQLLGFLDVANPAAITREQMDQWVKEGVVEYFDPTDDVRPWLAQADCVVLPSSYREGVPRTLLEAAAMARPVITTDAPGCRDTVLDGESGYLCRVRDSEDLGDKMLLFIDLSAQARCEMGRRGRRLVEERFDERIVLDRYLELVATIQNSQRYG